MSCDFTSVGILPVIFKSAYSEQISWNDIITLLDHKSAQSGWSNYMDISTNEVSTTGPFGFWFKDCYDIPVVKNVVDLMASQFPDYQITSEAFMSISRCARSIGLHSEPCDAFYWQGLGKTAWNFPDQAEGWNGWQVVEEGDMIFVPKYAEHEVEVLTPRFSVSMGVEDREERRAEYARRAKYNPEPTTKVPVWEGYDNEYNPGY